jgi:hypothetical protein
MSGFTNVASLPGYELAVLRDGEWIRTPFDDRDALLAAWQSVPTGVFARVLLVLAADQKFVVIQGSGPR